MHFVMICRGFGISRIPMLEPFDEFGGFFPDPEQIVTLSYAKPDAVGILHHLKARQSEGDRC